MLRASSTVDIPGVSPQEVLELVLDVDRYRELDDKIVEVGIVTGPDQAGRGSVELTGRLRFGPALPDVHDFVLERWSRLTFTGAPRQPGRLVFEVTGTFVCEPTTTGTEVTHSYTFSFRLPFRWLEAVHRTWLQDELDVEMERIVEELRPERPMP